MAVGFVVHLCVFVEVVEKFAEGLAIIFTKVCFELDHIVLGDGFDENPFQ